MTKTDRLLIISRGAGSVTAEVEATLRAEFAGHEVVDFDPGLDMSKLIAPGGHIVVAGGDGTVGHVVRGLAELDHPLGIIPLGTFNNFARALGLPADLGEAIAVVKSGRLRAITLGRVNGQVFLEACVIGLFGEAIILGDMAKDLRFGEVVEKMREVITAESFEYELSGNLAGRGSTKSLVFTNTASIGLQLPISGSSPTDPFLEFVPGAGQSVSDIVGRALASTLLDKHEEERSGQAPRFGFRRLHVRTKPLARVYADNRLAGETPCDVSAAQSGLRVFVPR